MITVNGFQPLTIITKSSILDVAGVLDPPQFLELSEDYFHVIAFPSIIDLLCFTIEHRLIDNEPARSNIRRGSRRWW